MGATGKETPRLEAAAENTFWMGAGREPEAAAAAVPVNATAVVAARAAFAHTALAKKECF